MDTQLTFEQVDAHIKSANLKEFEAGGAKHFKGGDVKAAPADVLQKVCGIYNVVKPILSIIANLPLIPAKWKEAVKTFMNLMNTICP
jgi:hypothetical protein